MNSYISTDPNILGGVPVIKGTRVPVDRIKFLLKEEYTLNDIQEMYPHVSRDVFKNVIDEIFKSALAPKHDKTSKV